MNKKHLILHTPLIPVPSHVNDTAKLYLKAENLQLLGSYKIRGVVSVIENTDQALLKGGLSAASAGNMAQALAYVARECEIPCNIYVPDSAPDIKKNMITKLGANLIELPYEEVWGMVRGDIICPDQGFFVHPVLNEHLRVGYASIADEIVAELPEVDAIVIPFGVGGLSLGVGMAMRRLKPDVSIFTCEPETAAPLKASILRGCAASVERIPSFVDAIGVPEVLPQVYALLAPVLQDSLVVSLADIRQAWRLAFYQHKLLCEGAAACSLAAAIQLAARNEYKHIVCILSGGNLSANVIQSFLVD